MSDGDPRYNLLRIQEEMLERQTAQLHYDVLTRKMYKEPYSISTATFNTTPYCTVPEQARKKEPNKKLLLLLEDV